MPGLILDNNSAAPKFVSRAFVSCVESVTVKMRTEIWRQVQAYQADKLVLRGTKVSLTIHVFFLLTVGILPS